MENHANHCIARKNWWVGALHGKIGGSLHCPDRWVNALHGTRDGALRCAEKHVGQCVAWRRGSSHRTENHVGLCVAWKKPVGQRTAWQTPQVHALRRNPWVHASVAESSALIQAPSFTPPPAPPPRAGPSWLAKPPNPPALPVVSEGPSPSSGVPQRLTWVIFSRLALGLRGASVSRVGCSSGATRSSL